MSYSEQVTGSHTVSSGGTSCSPFPFHVCCFQIVHQHPCSLGAVKTQPLLLGKLESSVLIVQKSSAAYSFMIFKIMNQDYEKSQNLSL